MSAASRHAPAVTRPDGAATKGREVEEWIDLHFFRPIGIRLARAFYPTRVTPDQVTLLSLIIGLAAGHCFVYTSPSVNFLGFALFIVSDLFDSADGQLARLRGTSTRFGRILDGLSDNARFANLYIHVVVRLVLHDGWSVWLAVGFAILAGFSHSWQSAAIDCIRHAYLELGVGTGSELELPEDLESHAARAHSHPEEGEGSAVHRILHRFGRAAYSAYVRRQQWLCPATMRLVRRMRVLEAEGATESVGDVRDAYRDSERSVVRQCAWLGQNIRFPLVGIPGILNIIAGFLWLTVVPLNLVLAAILVVHERRARRILAMTDNVAVAVVAP